MSLNNWILLTDPMEQFIVFSGDYSDNLLVSQRAFARIFPAGMGGFTLYTLATGFVIFLSSLVGRRPWARHVRWLSMRIRSMTRKSVTNTTFAPFAFMLSSIYLSIWFSNLIGLMPYSPTPTASVVGPATHVFACLFTAYIYAIILHKLAVFRALFPKSTPVYLMWLIIAIEGVSFGAKSVSLIVRLFANMLAGHALLKIIISTIIGLFQSDAYWAFCIAVATLAEPLFLCIYYLELIIAFLQAYVFLTMSAIFIAEVIHLDH